MKSLRIGKNFGMIKKKAQESFPCAPVLWHVDFIFLLMET